MANSSFVHLHTHSEFSLLDGAAQLKGLVKQAIDMEMPALALTDHGAMYGSLEFYNLCRDAGIKPIIGVEAYVAPGSHRDRSHRPQGKSAHHLLLLARNLAGYRNLLKLTTTAAVDGFYSKPRIDHDLLARHREGLIATSACLGGEICAALLRDDFEGARAAAAFYRDVFGPDDFYIELQNHTLPEQARANEGLVKIARELGLPMICTNDVHYLSRDDAYAHDVLLCIGTGSNVNDASRLRYGAEEFYMKSPEEMRRLFSDFPEAVERTLEIAERCNLELEFGRALMPSPGLPASVTPQSYLRDLAMEGLERKVAAVDDKYRKRLEYELGVIEQTGFSQYILIVRDFALFARDRGIFYGVRGSAAGSLTSYCVDITDIDPVEYGLTFERFLNPERIQMPDIDMDFEDGRRGEVIEYVTRKYGEDHVAQIITFGTLAARAALKDSGRALAYTIPEVNRLVNLVPNAPHMTLDRARGENPELEAAYQSDTRARDLIETARRLEGLSRNASVHAAGVVISHDPLVEYTPLQKSNTGGLVTQYGAGALEKLGLLKMDFLGLINLSILGRAVENIRRSRGVEIDVRNLPLDDDGTFDLLGRGETTGIFQLESAGMRRVITQLRPTSVLDLSAMVALYRPGPMDHIPTFIKGKHGLEKIRYPHERLQSVLEETYGVIVYQDQVMLIAQAIGGYTLGQADILRRAMGKKKKEEMARERQRFLSGAAANGISEQKANEIFDLIEPFAGYAFNKAHAVCYAMVAYQTAYLKAHYPVEYMAALLACYMDKPDKIATCLDECRRMRVVLLGPDVNRSGVDFSAEGESIRFGLAGIKNVGRAATELILSAREVGGPFASLHDLCARTQERGGVTRATIEALIQCGALDALHPCRRSMLEAVESVLQSAARSQRDREAGQSALFGGMDDDHCPAAPLPDVPEFREDQRLAYEKELLGVYLSGHPLDKFRAAIERAAPVSVADLQEYEDGQPVAIGGILTTVTQRITKVSKERMASMTLEDLTGHSIEVTVFPAVFREYGGALAKDAIVVITGRAQFREQVREEEDAERPVELRADSVAVISEAVGVADASGAARIMHIRLDPGTRDRLALLKTALKNHSGQSPVWLHVPVGNRIRKAVSGFSVDGSDALRQTVEQLVGRQAVWLE